jgi:hypothetical protein
VGALLAKGRGVESMLLPPSPAGVGTNKLAAAWASCMGTGIKVGRVFRFSVPCSGSAAAAAEVVGKAGGNASARGPHENPINDDGAELVESKAADKDERRTLFEAFPDETGPGLGRVIDDDDNPGETDDDDGWKKTENGYPCESESSYCAGRSFLLPVVAAPVFVVTILGSVYVN